jgi:predicted transcriptional regulator of viral defense system
VHALNVIQRVASSQDGVITLAQAVSAGLLRYEVDRLCRSGRWRRIARAVYLVNGSGELSRLARIRAAAISLGSRAVVVLDTAAELYGIGGLPRTGTVHVSLPGDSARTARPNDPAIVIHQLTLQPHAITSVNGILTTTPQQTVADIVLRVGRYPAVCVLDSGLNQGWITLDDFPYILRLLRGRRGAIAARKYLVEADGRAQSPLETRARLRCVDGKVAPDVLQQEVRDDYGHLLGVGDLAWLRPRIIGEADGAGPHGTPEALFADRHRQNNIMNAGWHLLRFTWQDTLRPDIIPAKVRAAIAVRSADRPGAVDHDLGSDKADILRRQPHDQRGGVG